MRSTDGRVKILNHLHSAVVLFVNVVSSVQGTHKLRRGQHIILTARVETVKLRAFRICLSQRQIVRSTYILVYTDIWSSIHTIHKIRAGLKK